MVDFPLVNSPDALLWMVQMHCIDMNAWYSRVDKPDRPDFVLFDLDPPEGALVLGLGTVSALLGGFERVRRQAFAQRTRRRLDFRQAIRGRREPRVHGLAAGRAVLPAARARLDGRAGVRCIRLSGILAGRRPEKLKKRRLRVDVDCGVGPRRLLVLPQPLEPSGAATGC